ncbi:MAG TPA: HK97 gp10 family phage protein [Marmoricola sp.]|nr:HK97 gp10 family phage protein [Marmoricola sp.]
MARTRVEYRPNHASMRRFMSSRQMADVVRAVAEKGRAAAESLASRDTGRYATSFEVETRQYGDRQTAVLYNTAPYAAVVEARDRVLGRSIDHMR